MKNSISCVPTSTRGNLYIPRTVLKTEKWACLSLLMQYSSFVINAIFNFIFLQRIIAIVESKRVRDSITETSSYVIYRFSLDAIIGEYERLSHTGSYNASKGLSDYVSPNNAARTSVNLRNTQKQKLRVGWSSVTCHLLPWDTQITTG